MAETLPGDIQADIDAIGRIEAISTILEVICRTTHMGFAAVARVTEDKWVACAVRDEIAFGLAPGGELALETTICNEIRQHHSPVVIDHVAEDPIFFNHHTPLQYGLQSYISIPIMLKDGTFFGTLCAIDTKPAHVNNPETIGMFRMFADLIAFHLHSNDQLAQSQARLLEERQTSELREQFIAILGHDLRNPVTAISNVAQLLLRMPYDDRIKRLATIAQDATFRIRGLIDNILDFARGRLGEGIVLDCSENEPLEKILTEVITELRLIWPDRILETTFDLTVPVCCDGKRIAQLFSNILSNAISHGDKNSAVIIKALSGKDEFILSVSNTGEKIPDAAMARLFQPFFRGEVRSGQQGLGLGLYISSEIAKAHGGTLEVTSTDEVTCFTLRLPVR